MAPESRPLGSKEIFRFWAPLAATWLMMAAEGPFLAAVIARLAEPKYNLAAFGVALSLALLLEAPVIMIMGAATALVKDRESFLKMRRFTYGLNALITAITLVLLVPPVFRWLAGPVLGLPQEVAWRTYLAVGVLLPWPAAIGYRRLYQGVLIRQGLTRRVGYGTAVRLCTMATTALALRSFQVEGAHVGAAALSSGVVLEAVASRLMVRGALRRLFSAAESKGPPLTHGTILAFYYPLALSSLLTLGVNPVLTFFVAQARAPVESLAVLPVVRSLVFIFSCLGLSYQEVGIALLGEDGREYAPVRRFALALGTATVAGLGLIAFTPAADIWFRTLSGLSVELTHFAIWPTRILVPVPGLTVLLSFLRSVFVHSRVTGPITWATVVEVTGIAAVLFVAIHHFDAVGMMAAAVALVAGRACSNLCLLVPRRKLTVPRPQGMPAKVGAP